MRRVKDFGGDAGPAARASRPASVTVRPLRGSWKSQRLYQQLVVFLWPVSEMDERGWNGDAGGLRVAPHRRTPGAATGRFEEARVNSMIKKNGLPPAACLTALLLSLVTSDASPPFHVRPGAPTRRRRARRWPPTVAGPRHAGGAQVYTIEVTLQGHACVARGSVSRPPRLHAARARCARACIV